MTNKHPINHFFCCGAAEGTNRANALDRARLSAGVGKVNLIKTGPVIPSNCSLVEASELQEGLLVPAIFASYTSTTPGEVISAGIAIAYPTDTTRAGIAMEYAASGHKEDIEALVRRMAEEALYARNLQLKEMHSLAVQHRVEKLGAVIATVVLIDE